MVLNTKLTENEHSVEDRKDNAVAFPPLAHDLKNPHVLRSLDISISEDIEFKNLLLPDFILQGLEKANFQRPSPIQLRSIPLLRLGLDLIVQSKAGTGKTLVLALAALETVQLQSRRLQVIVLAPTREIAQQTKHFITVITSGIQVRTEVFIGGTSVKEDKRNSLGCQIAIGTPGRISSLIESGDFSLSYVRLFVLDEADKLMEKSIFSQVKAISKSLPPNKQTILCSATFLHPVKDYVIRHMKEPFWVTPEEATRLQLGSLDHQKITSTVLLGVTQYFKEVQNNPQIVHRLKYKLEEILDILSAHPFTQCIIFSNHQTRAESICHQLVTNGWPALSVRGQDEQSHRTATLNAFKDIQSRVLLTTDVMSRGVDFRGVDLVINLDIPYDASTYLHRMGRAGRFGSYGCVITLASQGEEVLSFKQILADIGNATVYFLPSDLSVLKQMHKLTDVFFEPTPTDKCHIGTKFELENKDLVKEDYKQSSEEIHHDHEDSSRGQSNYRNLSRGSHEEDNTSKIISKEIPSNSTPELSSIVEKKNESVGCASQNQRDTVVKIATEHLSKALNLLERKEVPFYTFEELEKKCSDWVTDNAPITLESCGLKKGHQPKDWWTSASTILNVGKIDLLDIKKKSLMGADEKLTCSKDFHTPFPEFVASNLSIQHPGKKKKRQIGFKKATRQDENAVHHPESKAPESSRIPGKDETAWLWDEESNLFYMWDGTSSIYNLYNPYLKCYFVWDPMLNRYYKWDHLSKSTDCGTVSQICTVTFRVMKPNIL